MIKSIFKWLVPLILTFPAMAQNSKQLDANEFEKAIAQPDVQLVDVRTPEEFTQGHLKGALNADWKNLQMFEKEAQKLDTAKPVYVYCLAGIRSEQAADWLRKKGFNHVVGLRGGIRDWKDAGKPVGQ